MRSILSKIFSANHYDGRLKFWRPQQRMLLHHHHYDHLFTTKKPTGHLQRYTLK